MTLNDFINTGMMMTVEDIEENFGKTHSLDEKTKDVMRYAGDIYIQYLPESEWCYMSQTWLEVYSGKLSDVEKRVWENVIKPLINNL